MNRLWIAAAALLLFMLDKPVHGCHAGHESIDHDRRKRSLDEEERRSTHEDVIVFFGECMAGLTDNAWHWPTVVEYVVLHGHWFQVQGEQKNVAENDTVTAWKTSVQVLLRNDSDLMEPTKVCMNMYPLYAKYYDGDDTTAVLKKKAIEVLNRLPQFSSGYY